MSKEYSQNTHPKTGRQLNAKLLPILVGLFAVLYALTGYRGWLVFLIGFAGAWFLAALWVRTLEQSLSIERKIHLAWAHVGDSVPEQLIIINKSRLPAVWVEIVDESDTLATPIRLVSDVEPHITRRRNLSHLFRKRGVYTLGPTRLRTGDPFGIYTLTIRDQHSSTVLVTPPQLPLAKLGIPPGGWAGDRKRQRQAIAREISEAGVRDYAPGDSLRRIHWHSSAHRESLMVRQLEAATSEDWWIFADLEASVQAGTGLDSTLELVIVLAASLVTRGLKERHRVGLALVGPKLVWLEPRSDPAQRWRLLRALSAAEAGDRSLADLMVLGRPAQTATLVVITPTADPAWVAAAGRRLRRGNMKALLVNPAEFGSPIDQSRVSTVLAQRGIPYTRMPRALLEEAYSTSGWDSRKHASGIETRKRYVEQGRSNWQSID